MKIGSKTRNDPTGSPAIILIWLLLSCVPAGAQNWDNIVISTGDNQWNYDLSPVDSAATIEATCEALPAFGAKRIYWRGEQDLAWLQECLFRPELPLYFDFYHWEHYLNMKVKTNKLMAEAARRHGMQIYYWDALFEYGAQGDTPGCGALPSQAEMNVRLEHPEWISCDRWGERLAPGPLEYAYAGARRQFIDRVLRHVKNYDGVALYTYVENNGFRYPEEYGFNQPIVTEFKRRYGVDIRTQAFDKKAWYRLRGEFVTRLFRELHAALSKKGKKLSIVVWGDNPGEPMGWQRYTTWTTAGRIEMDYESWIREGIVDEFVVFHNTEPFVLKLLDLTKDKPISISVLGAATAAEAKGGVRTMIDVWGSICANRTTPAPVEAGDLSNPDWAKRAQVLLDAAAGALRLDEAAVVKAVGDPNVLVRRQAVRTLMALKATNQAAVVEKALLDQEPSVQVAAVAALGTIHGPNSPQALVEALRLHGTSLTKRAAILSFKAMRADAEPVLLAGLKDRSAAVRWVSAQALADSATEQSREALFEALRTDSDYRVRFYALQSLQARPGPGLAACRLGLADNSPTVHLAAVSALGALAPGLSKSDASPALKALLIFFREYGDGCERSDAAWGWRVVGNAIAAFGEPGKRELESFRLQRKDKWLAWAAYLVLYVPQPNDDPVLTTEAEAVATHAKFAPPFPGWRMDKKTAFPNRGR